LQEQAVLEEGMRRIDRWQRLRCTQVSGSGRRDQPASDRRGRQQ
jgi:hypothetical protein